MSDSIVLPTHSRFKNLTGHRFGRLTVAEFVGMNKKRGATWRCRCDCGGSAEIVAVDLSNGNTSSCGCKKRDVLIARNLRHGLKFTPEYNVWNHMINRCRNPNTKSFHRYGGRGISVCERWQNFGNFYADMGPRPSAKHEIDRYPDNNGNYEPSNVRWATKTQQGRNRVTNRWIEYDGRSLTLIEWSEITGISRGTIWDRLDNGWSIADALTRPPRVSGMIHK